MDFVERREFEQHLRDAVEQTKALYDGAREAFDRAKELHDQLDPHHPDGSLRHATHVYIYTQRNFRKALMEFNRFILDQNQPETGLGSEVRPLPGIQSRNRAGVPLVHVSSTCPAPVPRRRNSRARHEERADDTGKPPKTGAEERCGSSMDL